MITDRDLAVARLAVLAAQKILAARNSEFQVLQAQRQQDVLAQQEAQLEKQIAQADAAAAAIPESGVVAQEVPVA